MKLVFSLVTLFLSLPAIMYAQDKVYSPLVDLSNAGQGNEVQTFEAYINFLYGMSIAVAALLAVIKIIIAGTKYMLSDIISDKGGAIEDIKGAILGLLLIISAVVILELINPNLIDRDITFPQIDPSTRGDLKSMAVQTVAGGQTQEQYSANLGKGLDACVKQEPPKKSGDGQTSVTVASASDCANTKEQLAIFERNCASSGGTAKSGGTGSKTVTCAIKIDGAAETKEYNTKMQETFGAQNVKTEGTQTTIDIHSGCYEKFKDAASKTSYDSCLSQARADADLACSVRSDTYGKFSLSKDGKTATCQLPRQIKGVNDFKGFNPDFPNAVPTSEDEFEKACQKAGGTYEEDANTDLSNYWSPENDKCIVY